MTFHLMGVEVGRWHKAAERLVLAVSPMLVRQRNYATTATAERSYYQTLELDSRATHAEIKKAYYKLSKVCALHDVF